MNTLLQCNIISMNNLVIWKNNWIDKQTNNFAMFKVVVFGPNKTYHRRTIVIPSSVKINNIKRSRSDHTSEWRSKCHQDKKAFPHDLCWLYLFCEPSSSVLRVTRHSHTQLIIFIIITVWWRRYSGAVTSHKNTHTKNVCN